MTVAGLGIALPGKAFHHGTERDGLLGTVLGAGIAGLAFATEGYALVRKGEILVGAHPLAGHALDTFIGIHRKHGIAAHIFIALLHHGQHLFVETAHLGRSDVLFACAHHVLQQGGQILIRVLVHLHLLVHQVYS